MVTGIILANLNIVLVSTRVTGFNRYFQFLKSKWRLPPKLLHSVTFTLSYFNQQYILSINSKHFSIKAT